MRPALGRIEGLPVDVLRAATVFREAVGLAQQAPGAPRQPRVVGQPHDILDALRFQEIQPVVPRKAPIHPHRNTGKRPTQLTEQGSQEPERAVLGRTVPRPQNDRDQILFRFVVERQRGHQRQVAPCVVMPVEERQLLLPMRRVVRGIEIDREALGVALEPVAVLRDDRRRQHPPHPIQGPWAPRMFKPGERGLRGQGIPGYRIAPHRQLVQGIVDQPGRIVAVLISTRQALDALAQQVADRVPDFVGISGVRQARRHRCSHAPDRIGRPSSSWDRM